VLTLVALYGCALLATSFFGPNSMVMEDAVTPDQHRLFGNVPSSMFTLFALMNGQYWQDIRAILDKLLWAKPVYVLFTILSSWALLSIMTGVVSDNMLKVRHQKEIKDEDEMAELRSRILEELTDIFNSADLDGNGKLERREYQELLASQFHMDKIQRLTEVGKTDLRRLFDWLENDAGHMEVGEFLQGIEWLNNPVTGRSLLKLEYSIKRLFYGVKRSVFELQSDVISAKDQREQEAAEKMWLLRHVKQNYEAQAAEKCAEAAASRKEANKLLDECRKLCREHGGAA
jgi:hypothetical protein